MKFMQEERICYIIFLLKSKGINYSLSNDIYISSQLLFFTIKGLTFKIEPQCQSTKNTIPYTSQFSVHSMFVFFYKFNNIILYYFLQRAKNKVDLIVYCNTLVTLYQLANNMHSRQTHSCNVRFICLHLCLCVCVCKYRKWP